MPVGFWIRVYSREAVWDRMSWTGMEWKCSMSSGDLGEAGPEPQLVRGFNALDYT